MRTNRKRTGAGPIAAAIAGLMTAAALLGGCPGTLDNPERFKTGGACPDIPAFLATKCTNAGCHGATNPAAKLDLKTPDLAARVAGQPASFCLGSTLANPDDPESSVLFRKLTDTPTCGSSMPLGQPALSETEIDCVLEWIATLEASPPSDAGTSDADNADAADGAD